MLSSRVTSSDVYSYVSLIFGIMPEHGSLTGAERPSHRTMYSNTGDGGCRPAHTWTRKFNQDNMITMTPMTRVRTAAEDEIMSAK